MRPSSAELTCPLNPAPGALAAPMKLAAAKNNVAAALATAIAKKTFFIVELLHQIDLANTQEMQRETKQPSASVEGS
jgi:hypothetical protein